MTPVDFPQQNVVFAKDQAEYLPLPAHRVDEPEGRVISCWRLTLRERVLLLFTGRLWLTQLTFNGPLQPQLPQIKSPYTEQ